MVFVSKTKLEGHNTVPALSLRVKLLAIYQSQFESNAEFPAEESYWIGKSNPHYEYRKSRKKTFFIPSCTTFVVLLSFLG
jgi:hypothetical protein